MPAQQQNTKLFELRFAITLARLWRNQSKRAEASDMLSPIYHWPVGYQSRDHISA